MTKKYKPSGEGYFVDLENPCNGVYGISPEIEEQRKREFQEQAEIDKYHNKIRVIKAMNLIREIRSRDPEYKISLLKKLGHKNIYVKGGKINLDKITEKYYPNLHRAYERIVNELDEIVKNPSKKSTLADRLDSME